MISRKKGKEKEDDFGDDISNGDDDDFMEDIAEQAESDGKNAKSKEQSRIR